MPCISTSIYLDVVIWYNKYSKEEMQKVAYVYN